MLSKTSFCLAPDSGEGGKATGLDHLSGGLESDVVF